MANQNKKPSTIFRIGAISGSIFSHEVETDSGTRTIRSVSLQRRYKDGDETKYSSSFGIADIPLAIRVLEISQQHIEAAEAEVSLE